MEANPQDCPVLRSLNIFCTSCESQLGHFNFRTAAVTLFKWQTAFPSITASSPSSLPSVSQCLAAILIATVARSGSSKSLIMPVSETSESRPADRKAIIHLWVLNSTIKYASSSGKGVVPAIKLLYRPISKREAEKMLENITSDAQEVNLPQEDVGAVMTALEDSNELLPLGDRLFKGWKVGLLRRWE